MAHSIGTFVHAPLSRRQLLLGFGATAGLALGGPIARGALALTEVVIDAPTDGRDATAEIMRQIDGAPDGSIIRFPIGRSQGRYRVDGRLYLSDRKSLTIIGPSAGDPATIWTDKVGQDVGILNHKGYSARQHWHFYRCQGITARNLRVEGPNTLRDEDGYSRITTSYEAEHAFCVNMSSNVRLIDCSALSVYGDGCWLHAPHGYKTSNVTVQRFTTTSNGRHGAGIFNVDGVVVDGLKVVKGGVCGVDMEPNGPEDSTLNVEIRNSTIDTRTVAFAAMGAEQVSNIWIHHNTVAFAKNWPFVAVGRRDGGRSRNWVVEDNQQTFLTSPAQGLNFIRVDNVAIRRNYVELRAWDSIAGARFTDCGGQLEVINNDFTGAGASYAKDDETTAVTASGNSCRNC